MAATKAPRFVPDPSRPYQLENGLLAIWLPRGRGRDDRAEGILAVVVPCPKAGCDCTMATLYCARVDDRLAWAKYDKKLSAQWKVDAPDLPKLTFEYARLDLMSGAVLGLEGRPIPESLRPFFERPLPSWVLDELYARAGAAYAPPPDAWLEHLLSDWEPGVMLSELQVHPELRPELLWVDGKRYVVDLVFCPRDACDCRGHRMLILEVEQDCWTQVASAKLTETFELEDADGDRPLLRRVFDAWRERVVHPEQRFEQARARVRERAPRLNAEWAARRPPPPPAPRPAPVMAPSIGRLPSAPTQLSPSAGPRNPALPKPGRNDPCPCLSGRKYKHCHGR